MKSPPCLGRLRPAPIHPQLLLQYQPRLGRRGPLPLPPQLLPHGFLRLSRLRPLPLPPQLLPDREGSGSGRRRLRQRKPCASSWGEFGSGPRRPRHGGLPTAGANQACRPHKGGVNWLVTNNPQWPRWSRLVTDKSLWPQLHRSSQYTVYGIHQGSYPAVSIGTLVHAEFLSPCQTLPAPRTVPVPPLAASTLDPLPTIASCSLPLAWYSSRTVCTAGSPPGRTTLVMHYQGSHLPGLFAWTDHYTSTCVAMSLCTLVRYNAHAARLVHCANAPASCL